MKTNLYLTSLLAAAAALCSCTDDLQRVSDAESKKNTYEQAFISRFGQYSPSNTWNTARAYSLDITPGSTREVKIYAPCGDVYRLVARYEKASEPFTARFDAPKWTSDFVVSIDGVLYKAGDGSHVSSASTRATDVTVSDSPMQWIMAVENDFNYASGTSRLQENIDFDFNDIVLGITSVVTDDNVSVDITPLACGDDQPFYLRIVADGTDRLLWQSNNSASNDCEFHQWFGVRNHTMGVNTGMLASGVTGPDATIKMTEAIVAAISGCHIDVGHSWTMSRCSDMAYNHQGNLLYVNGLYISVGSYKPYTEIYDDSRYAVIAGSGPGRASRVLVFPDCGAYGSWQWPLEGIAIDRAYPMIKDWFVTPDHEQAMKWNEWLPLKATTRERP